MYKKIVLYIIKYIKQFNTYYVLHLYKIIKIKIT